MKNIVKLFMLIPFLVACEDVFTPELENIRDVSAMPEDPSYAQGILANAYILLPYSSSPSSDVATDDAVSTSSGDSYLKMATGAWTSNYDPMSQWQSRRNAIQYLNLFLANSDKVQWASDSIIRSMYNDRMKGEAYGLRALQMLYLLRAHGGWSASGELLGVPIVTKPEDPTSDFNYPRNTFQQCIAQIYSDADSAMQLLPLDYNTISNTSDIPQKYINMNATVTGYNRVNGNQMKGRISGRIVEAILAQTALLAASPAFAQGTKVTWEDAARYASTVLNRIGGVSGLASNGFTWYTNTSEIANISSGANPAEILWRGGTNANNTLETNNFPPSLYGKGYVNPTQNLVDAFPMVNGYPISNASSQYNAADPYSNRDPRLNTYILVNGGTQGPSNSVITTATYATNNDGINAQIGLSTRTGYYLKKLLRSDCNVNPNYNTTQTHYTAYIRYTEIFLDYAEAANEAYGPLGTGTSGYSAYDVIKAIRKRAGVGVTNNDAYLESIKSDQAKMRELIHNERRLELCFENTRFYDLRRWKSSLTEAARGMMIGKNTAGVITYTPLDNVESRQYKEYMYYGPIPYSETLKYDKLVQNAGW